MGIAVIDSCGLSHSHLEQWFSTLEAWWPKHFCGPPYIFRTFFVCLVYTFNRGPPKELRGLPVEKHWSREHWTWEVLADDWVPVFPVFIGRWLRPCVRRKFPNFSFSRVSEMFGFRSSEIFRKKLEFSNSRNFRVKVRKKVRKFNFGNYSKIS